MQPATLAEGLPEREFRSERAQDSVIVVVFSESGPISYRKSDGKSVHTLNNAAGLHRKLVDLKLHDDILHSDRKNRIDAELTGRATAVAGTRDDLDPDLEAAGLEIWQEQE